MSLLIARKQGPLLFVVGDTHLTHPINDNLFKVQKVSNPEEGVIKSVILNSQICISFAGEIEPAGKAISICRKFNNRIDLILNHLLDVNKKTDCKTEFIICLGTPILKLALIKSKKIEYCDSCWIGSANGFNKFQKVFQTLKENKLAQSLDYLTLTQDSLKEVIESSDIPEVNGFKITVTNHSGTFTFSAYIETISMEMKLIGTHGKTNTHVITHGTAQKGGYTVNVWPTEDNYSFIPVHILQGNFGIVYSLKEDGLLHPNIFPNKDEHEFAEMVLDKYNSKIGYCISSKQKSYFERGNKKFEEREYEKAIEFYSKGLMENETELKAALYFNKAICLFHLSRIKEATNTFNDAIKLNSSLQPRVFQFINQNFNKK